MNGCSQSKRGSGKVLIGPGLAAARLLRRCAPRNDRGRGHCERSAAISVAGPAGQRKIVPAIEPDTWRAALVEPFVFDFLIRALAFALSRRALFFAAPEPNSVFFCLSLGRRAPPLLAVLIEVDDHPWEASGSQKMPAGRSTHCNRLPLQRNIAVR